MNTDQTLNTWSSKKWEQDQIRLKNNYQKAKEQMERTEVLQEKYQNQIAQVKAMLERSQLRQQSSLQYFGELSVAS